MQVSFFISSPQVHVDEVLFGNYFWCLTDCLKCKILFQHLGRFSSEYENAENKLGVTE